ncbi:hypothetical protein OUZ56_032766 [Daphnia magna]|uniref:Uncharacterized protein n=1 Tax=Daphnia magna TaxID=35525 RepID=A0ABQ9ZXR7_9CRUS|nr:hypothetical protein OUZ56_032766 [Daphnia magna]
MSVQTLFFALGNCPSLDPKPPRSSSSWVCAVGHPFKQLNFYVALKINLVFPILFPAASTVESPPSQLSTYNCCCSCVTVSRCSINTALSINGLQETLNGTLFHRYSIKLGSSFPGSSIQITYQLCMFFVNPYLEKCLRYVCHPC